MKPEAIRVGFILRFGTTRMLTLFGISLLALTYSTVVGIKSVRADGACTSAQCNQAADYAFNTCFNHYGNVLTFVCPVPNETDDFLFICDDVYSYSELDDCSNNAPS